MQVEIDADICGGFGTCVLLPDVPEDLEGAVQEAVALCPTHAISITPSDE